MSLFRLPLKLFPLLLGLAIASQTADSAQQNFRDHPRVNEALARGDSKAALDALVDTYGSNPVQDRQGRRIFSDVLQVFKGWARTEFDDAEAAANLARSYSRAAEWVMSGSSAWNVGHQLWSEAFGLASQSVRLEPQESEYRVLRCDLSLWVNRHEIALADCAKAIDLGVNNEKVFSLLANAQSAAGDLEAALASFNTARTLAENPARHAYKTIGILERLGRYNEAITLFETEIDLASALSDEPSEVDHRNHANQLKRRARLNELLGRDSLASRDYNLARDSYQAACKLKRQPFCPPPPDWPTLADHCDRICGREYEEFNQVAFQAALAEIRQGRFQAALEAFEKIDFTKGGDFPAFTPFSGIWLRVWLFIAETGGGRPEFEALKKLEKRVRSVRFSAFLDLAAAKYLIGTEDLNHVVEFPKYSKNIDRYWEKHRCWALTVVGYRLFQQNANRRAREILEQAVAEAKDPANPCLQAKAALELVP